MKAPAKAAAATKKAPAKVKPPPPVPEHTLKKRKAQEAIAAAKSAKLIADKKASKIERKSILDKTAKYYKEYETETKELVAKRRLAKATNNFFMEPEPKVMLVVRIRGINAVDPKTRKILQLMRLRQVSSLPLL
jgi:large subunit ribosomal protein L7e